MKSRKLLVILLTFIALLSCIGSVFAYMFKKTEVVPNEFVPATVSCQVVETFSDNKKTSIQIENTSNIEAYLRLHLITYWIDEDDNILFKPLPDPYFTWSEENQKAWLKVGDTYYYRYPVQPGSMTGNLLEGTQIELKENAEGNRRNRQVVEVFAEAIQSLPEEAVEASWNDVEVSDDRSLDKKHPK